MKKGAIRHKLSTTRITQRFFMSFNRPLKIQTMQTFAKDSSFLADDSTPRVITTMAGDIFFANHSFAALAGIDNTQSQNILDVIEFLEPDDVFRHSSLLFAAENNVFDGLRTGNHDIIFKQTNQQTSFQFDRVKSMGGVAYIVISALSDDKDFAKDVDVIINKHDVAVQSKNIHHFLDLSNDALCSCHSDGTLKTINGTFLNLLDYSFDELSGRSFLDLIHPDDKAAVRAIMLNLSQDDHDSDIIDFECRLISKNAQAIWMHWKHKKTDGAVYSAGRDITATKKHEMVLQRREQQLLEAEAIGHMGHWYWKLGQQEFSFSDEIYRIFGTPRGAFNPTLDNVNERIHRRDVGRMEQAFQRAIIEQNDHEIDFRILTPSGETRHVKCQGRCELDSDGYVIGLFGIMQDVTESVQHERALMEAKDGAERAYAAKSQFLANMSHELRTPLNAIIGFSEMMQQQLLGPIGNDRYIDYIKGINESGQHLLDLITDILDMSKIEAGKYELCLEDISIAKVIRMAAHMVESRANEHNIKIIITIPDESLKIRADRRAVMQMTLNLLSNAVKFSHPQGRIEVDCVGKKDSVLLRVKDYGIGIPANKLPTITNPFEQAANQYTRSHEGSGLGLSITKELAELHGGGIHIESTINIGTSVTIRLPLDASKAQ